MSTNKKVGILISVVILFVTVIVGYLTIDYSFQERKLKSEILKLTKLDISKDTFNTKVVTRGSYGKVEGAIKDYLNEYAVNLQEINSLVNNDKINKLISYDNLNNDNYNNYINYVNDSIDTINGNIDILIDLCDEETIRYYILQYDLDKYYVDLYNDLMLSDDVSKNLIISIDYLKEYKEYINNKFNTCFEILDFLNNNKDNYSLEDGEIKFKDNDLYNQYNGYIDKITA